MSNPVQSTVMAITRALAGCAAAPQQASSIAVVLDPGGTKATALEVCKPPGERAYLNRFRCSDGSKPAYLRIGSFGNRNHPPANPTKEQEAVLVERIVSGAPLKPGEADYHVIDGYQLSCGATRQMVYLDMYHCGQDPPTVAPKGFTLD